MKVDIGPRATYSIEHSELAEERGLLEESVTLESSITLAGDASSQERTRWPLGTAVSASVA